MINRKLVALPIGIAALAVGSVSASAYTDIGNSSASNNQSITTSQTGTEAVGGGVISGPTTETGINSGATAFINNSSVGSAGPGPLIGNTAQANGQAANTTQGNSLTAGTSGATAGTTALSAGNATSTTGTNTQSIGSAGTPIITSGGGTGTTTQTATQSLVGNQQNALTEGGGVVLGTTTEAASNGTANGIASLETIGATAGLIVGNGTETSAQTTNTPQGNSLTVGFPGGFIGGPTALSHTNAVSNIAGSVLIL